MKAKIAAGQWFGRRMPHGRPIGGEIPIPAGMYKVNGEFVCTGEDGTMYLAEWDSEGWMLAGDTIFNELSSVS